MEDKIHELEQEVLRLKEVVKQLTAALKVLTDKEVSAAAFVSRVEELLNS